MPKIGFGEMESHHELQDKQETKELFQFETDTDVYLSEKTKNRLLKEYQDVVVYDYGDDYHISEEERREKNKFYIEFSKLSKAKRKYKRLDEYVKAMRQTLKCLDMVAEDNFIYDPECFKQKWLSGKIEVYGLHHLQYKGKDRKQINWEYLSEFILSDRDPKELLMRKEEKYQSEEEIKEYYESLYTPEELEKIMDHSHDQQDMIDFSNDVLEREKVAESISKKEMRKLIKSYPEVAVGMKSFQKGISDRDKIDNFGTSMSYSDVEELRRYDVQQNFRTSKDVMPDFQGDIFDDDDYDKYMYQLQEYNNRNIKENVNGKMKTLEEVDELETKSLLEENGWNIRKLYDNEERIKKVRIETKDREKRLKRLKKKLTRLSEEKEALKKCRTTGDYDYDRKRKRKKKGKKNR